MVWGVASLAAPKVLAMIFPKIQAKAKSMGVVIDQVRYEKISVSPWLTSVSAHQVSVNFDLVPQDKHLLSSSFQTESIRVQLRNPFKMRGAVQMDHFDVKFHQSDLPKDLPFDRFSDGRVNLGDVPLFSPRDAFKELIGGLIDLFDDNISTGDFEFSGTVQMKLGAENISAKIYTERKGDEFRLRFSEDDVRNAAAAMHIHLADDQVTMVSYFPLRIPLIALITERARQISLRFFSGDLWRQDALRHTIWSFMLTQSFGPEFAKVVTDAQESKPGNTHYERLMDYNNNAVGRTLVKEKVKLQQIPHIVITDPRIVLSPQAAKARGERKLLK